jgi:hypothetical protein
MGFQKFDLGTDVTILSKSKIVTLGDEIHYKIMAYNKRQD